MRHSTLQIASCSFPSPSHIMRQSQHSPLMQSMVCCCWRSYPVTTQTLNYAPVAVGIVLVGALLGFYCPVIGAKNWYRGEKHTVEDFTVRLPQPLACAWIPVGPACMHACLPYSGSVHYRCMPWPAPLLFACMPSLEGGHRQLHCAEASLMRCMHACLDSLEARYCTAMCRGFSKAKMRPVRLACCALG